MNNIFSYDGISYRINLQASKISPDGKLEIVFDKFKSPDQAARFPKREYEINKYLSEGLKLKEELINNIQEALTKYGISPDNIQKVNEINYPDIHSQLKKLNNLTKSLEVIATRWIMVEGLEYPPLPEIQEFVGYDTKWLAEPIIFTVLSAHLTLDTYNQEPITPKLFIEKFREYIMTSIDN